MIYTLGVVTPFAVAALTALLAVFTGWVGRVRMARKVRRRGLGWEVEYHARCLACGAVMIGSKKSDMLRLAREHRGSDRCIEKAEAACEYETRNEDPDDVYPRCTQHDSWRSGYDGDLCWTKARSVRHGN